MVSIHRTIKYKTEAQEFNSLLSGKIRVQPKGYIPPEMIEREAAQKKRMAKLLASRQVKLQEEEADQCGPSSSTD